MSTQMSLLDYEWLTRCLDRGKHDIFFELKDITPALASVMLDSNTHNRKLRDTQASSHAAAMAEGRWKTTHQGIAIDKTGTLLDGQHRLEAVVEAGVPVEMVVSFGWDPSAFDVLDTGSTRRVDDFLTIDGVDNAATRAGAARLIATSRTNTKKKIPDKALVLEVAREMMGPEMDLACRVASSCTKIIRPSPLAAALWLIQTRTLHKTRVDTFVDGVRHGSDLPHNSPILKLRNTAHTMVKSSSGSNIAFRQLGAVILAWNAWVGGRPARSLTWDNWAIPEIL